MSQDASTFSQRRPASRGPEVDCQTALPRVQGHEQSRFAARPLNALPAIGVARRNLDLDHFCSHGGEQRRGLRAGYEPGQIEHPRPTEHSLGHHAAGSLNSPNSARKTPVISPTVAPALAASTRAGITLQPETVSSRSLLSACTHAVLSR